MLFTCIRKTWCIIPVPVNLLAFNKAICLGKVEHTSVISIWLWMCVCVCVCNGLCVFVPEYVFKCVCGNVSGCVHTWVCEVIWVYVRMHVHRRDCNPARVCVGSYVHIHAIGHHASMQVHTRPWCAHPMWWHLCKHTHAQAANLIRASHSSWRMMCSMCSWWGWMMPSSRQKKWCPCAKHSTLHSHVVCLDAKSTGMTSSRWSRSLMPRIAPAAARCSASQHYVMLYWNTMPFPTLVWRYVHHDSGQCIPTTHFKSWLWQAPGPSTPSTTNTIAAPTKKLFGPTGRIYEHMQLPIRADE